MVLAVVIAVLCAIPLGVKKLNFSATFYYVCYDCPSDATSASSISNLVHGYGGAGYIINCGGNYYVTVACYYGEKEAQTVQNNLAKKGLSCFVVSVKGDNYKLSGSASRYAKKYEGNLNSMLSVSRLCYDLANSLDKFQVGQSGAKSVLAEVSKTLSGLCSQNVNNCFTSELANLKAECEDTAYGYVFAYDVRRLQIAVCDAIINIKLY